MSSNGFKFHVEGIEDGIIAVLNHPQTGMSYLNTIVPYKGQLNRDGLRDTVKTALAALARSCPLVLVCYAEGGDEQDAPEPPLFGEPRPYRHDAAVVVIVADNDARGAEAQMRGTKVSPGVYQMIDDVRERLIDAEFEKIDPVSGDSVTLNTPLEPAGIEHIDRLPNITAYACHFNTSYRFLSPDRRGQTIRIDAINPRLEALTVESQL